MRNKVFILVILIFLSSFIACSAHQNPDSYSLKEIGKIMRDAGQPSEFHQVLKPLAGTWRARSGWRLSPNEEMIQSEAVSQKKWILNDLFLFEDYDDSNAKEPFKGLGIIGYDKVMNQYTSTWLDTMTTANWQSIGVLSEDKKTITFGGGGSCPLTNGYKEVRSELEIINDSKHIYRMYDTDTEGRSYLSLEIVYDRVG